MMFKRLAVFLTLLTFTIPAWAIGATIAFAIGGALVSAGTLTAAGIAVAMAINMVVSAVVTYAFQAANQPDSASGSGGGSAPSDTGSRLQVSPNTSNKVPVVYGTAYIGGTIVDLSVSYDSQDLYYVIALAEVTGISSPEPINFGKIYYGGKKVEFAANGYSVAYLYDESTGQSDTTVYEKIDIYLYSNGYNSCANGGPNAQQVMQAAGLTYTWDATKLMSNCAFAIIHLKYSVSANVRGINQTKFQITGGRTRPGDCVLDYMVNERYGCAIPMDQIDTASIVALNDYSDQYVEYIQFTGIPSTLKRYMFDGAVSMDRSCMDNLQDMMNCCNSLLKYNEITGKWGVIVQKPTYTVAMAITDSNMISAITITPMDIASSYNYIECKFPNSTTQDTFDSCNFDLSEIDPALLYPNEPVNKLSVNLPYVNNNVRAQLIANKLLKAGREDLSLTVDVMFVGLQLEAGDVVTVTSANYGWVAKLFRLIKVVESFKEDGSVVVKLTMTEFNPAVYDESRVIEFTPAPNTGIGDPTFFGSVSAPVVYSQDPTGAVPSFDILPTCTSSGIVQYAEVWYSAYSNPSSSQLYFAGTTSIRPDGNPYPAGMPMTLVNVTSIPAGSWYFFARMVNNLGSSALSPASPLFNWKPTTVQYTQRYLCVAYADSATGSGFSLSPRNKTHYGLFNSDSSTPPSVASVYTWYDAVPDFGSQVYLLYNNRNSRKFTTASGFAAQAAGTGAWVPTSTLIYDSSTWSALPDGTNAIDLDVRSGQLIQTGTTTVGTGEIAITNNLQGQVVAALQQYLNFGGAYSRTFTSGQLTVDIYGRVVGFEEPDPFYYSEAYFTATAGQKVFNVTRNANYITGQCWVFQNGCLLNTSEYTDSLTAITFPTGMAVGTSIMIVSFRSVSSIDLPTVSTSGTGTIATITFPARSVVPFSAGQSITVSGVTPSGYNGTYTVTACTTSTVSYANTTTGSQTVAGHITLANTTYPSFTRNSATLLNQGSYTASGFTLNSGYEILFLNGAAINAQDYDIQNQTISFIGNATGDLQIIQWSPNNLGVPNGTPINIDAFTTEGQSQYNFNYDPLAFNLFENGIHLVQGADFTTGTNLYDLVPAPASSINILIQQTFARSGAA